MKHTETYVQCPQRGPLLLSQLNYSIDLQTYYLQQSMWVDNMVDKTNSKYIYQKRGIYYLSKQVPNDVQHHYCRKKIVVSLRTKSPSTAIKSCTSMLQRLEDYWLSLRLLDKPLPGQHLLQSGYLETSQSGSPLMSEALATYLQLKGFDKDKTFIRGAKRNVK